MQDTTLTTLEQLQQAVTGHDWYYQMSDDYSVYSVYSEGQRQASRISTLYKLATAEGNREAADAIIGGSKNRKRY